MTKQEFLINFENCFQNLLSAGFPLPEEKISSELHFTHSAKYFGICAYRKGLFHLGFNLSFVKNGTKDAIINTIYHELLHTLPNCQNHGKIWKMYANRVKNLFGYNIQRCGGDKTFQDSTALKNSY